MPSENLQNIRVGFIGLGRMGSGMAANIARSGASLTVYDQVPAAVEAIVALGATAASSIAELAASVDVIFTSLPGPAEAESVSFGEGGLLSAVRPGTVLFDLTSSTRALALRLNEAYRKIGCDMLDAPVSGGPAGARSGELVLWIGGDRDVFDQKRAVIETFGKPHYVGPIGAGAVTKLAHNLLGYVILEAQAEAFSLAAKAGLDPLDFWEALSMGMVGKQSPLLMLNQQFLPYEFDNAAFAQRLALKDVRLALQMAKDLEVPMPLSEAMAQDMEAVVARGEGEGDSRSFTQLQVERSGVTIKVPRAKVEAAVERFRARN